MQTATSEITARVDSFVAELTALVRRAALGAVEAALTGAPGRKPAAAAAAPVAAPAAKSPRAAAAKPAPKRAAVAAKKAVPAKAAPAPAKAPAKKAAAKVGKRGAAEIEQTTSNLLAHIKAHPGQRMEDIRAALGVPTKELTLPIKKLLGDGKIATQGQKRATTYTAR